MHFDKPGTNDRHCKSEIVIVLAIISRNWNAMLELKVLKTKRYFGNRIYETECSYMCIITKDKIALFAAITFVLFTHTKMRWPHNKSSIVTNKSSIVTPFPLIVCHDIISRYTIYSARAIVIALGWIALFAWSAVTETWLEPQCCASYLILWSDQS